jgi:hypothetical protein
MFIKEVFFEASNIFVFSFVSFQFEHNQGLCRKYIIHFIAFEKESVV